MTPDDIRSALENTTDLPLDALRAGVAVAPDLAPSIIAVIEKATSGDTLSSTEEQLLFFGLYVLAAARDHSAYPAFMRLLGRTEHELETLLSADYATIATRLLLGLFDGDVAPLLTALVDQKMDGSARWAVFNALARLTWEGQVPLAVTTDVIDRFDRDRLARDGDLAWEGWQNAIMYLALADRAPKVRAAWAAGRFPLQRTVERDEWEQLLTRAIKDPQDEGRFNDDYIAPILDPVAALTGGEGLGPTPPETTVSPDGRMVSMKFDQALGIFAHSDASGPTRSAKVGRNEPCPCGSGKKYKRCCGGIERALH